MDYFRRLLQKIRMLPSDEELGDRTAVYPPDGRRPTVTSYVGEEYHIELSDKLLEFRLLVGITTHGSFKAPRGFTNNQRPVVTTSGRPAPNRGIYATVVDNEIKQKKAYKLFSRLINGCLGLQIVVAAALTALGAANGSRSAVTVFGAINTVIAGLMTYLKGSGLPGRLQYFQHEWTVVREYIEQKERDLSLPNDINVLDEVRYIRFMFENVREDIEANRPDRFIGTGGPKHRHPPPQQSGQGDSTAGLWRSNTDNQRINSGLSDGFMKMKEKVDGLQKDIGSAASSEANHMSGDLGRLKNRLQEKMSEIEGLEKDIESEGRRAMKRREAELSKTAGDKMKEMGDLEKEIESMGRQKEHEIEVKATDAIVDAAGRIQATIELKDPFKEEKREL